MTNERLQQLCETFLCLLENEYCFSFTQEENPDFFDDNGEPYFIEDGGREILAKILHDNCKITKEELHELGCGNEYDKFIDELNNKEKSKTILSHEEKQDRDIEHIKEEIENIHTQIQNLVKLVLE